MNQSASHRKLKGQYFTPREVTRLAWDLLLTFSGWRKGAAARVADPAVGEGIFLAEAYECLGPQAVLFGADIDPGLVAQWSDWHESGVPLDCQVLNGLCDRPEAGFEEGSFDFVVGNPPFGGEGLRRVIDRMGVLGEGEGTEGSQTPDDPEKTGDVEVIGDILRHLESWIPPGIRKSDLPADWEKWRDTGERPTDTLVKALRRLRRYSIEALFLERFVRLTRPGGWIAVVLPDGLLANDRHLHVREWVLRHAALRSVVSLPRKTFAGGQTSANTSLVVLQRPEGSREPPNEAVFFASPGFSSPGLPDSGKARSVEPAGGHAAAPRPIAIGATDYFAELPAAASKPRERGAHCLWVAADRVEAKRWHSGYVHPELCIPSARNMRYPLQELGDFVESITYGPIITGRRVQDEGCGEVKIIGQGAIIETGIDLREAPSVKGDSDFDRPRSRPRPGDLLLPRSGMGSLAKNKVAVFLGGVEANVGCFVDVVRLRELNPFYCWLFLKTDYGFDQIRRLLNGVGTVNLSFSEIRSLAVPVAPHGLQQDAESLYRERVLPLHHECCAAGKSSGSERGLREQAEREFRALVSWLRGEVAR